MTAAALLEAFRAHGVELTAVDGHIRYRAPAGVMTPAAVAALRAAKEQLLVLLATPIVEISAPLAPPELVIMPKPPVAASLASRTDTFLLQLVPIRIATGYPSQSRIVVRAVNPVGGAVLISTDQNELNMALVGTPVGNISIVPVGQFETFFLYGRQPLYAKGSVGNVTCSVITSEERHG